MRRSVTWGFVFLVVCSHATSVTDKINILNPQRLAVLDAPNRVVLVSSGDEAQNTCNWPLSSVTGYSGSCTNGTTAAACLSANTVTCAAEYYGTVVVTCATSGGNFGVSGCNDCSECAHEYEFNDKTACVNDPTHSTAPTCTAAGIASFVIAGYYGIYLTFTFAAFLVRFSGKDGVNIFGKDISSVPIRFGIILLALVALIGTGLAFGGVLSTFADIGLVILGVIATLVKVMDVFKVFKKLIDSKAKDMLSLILSFEFIVPVTAIIMNVFAIGRITSPSVFFFRNLDVGTLFMLQVYIQLEVMFVSNIPEHTVLEPNTIFLLLTIVGALACVIPPLIFFNITRSTNDAFTSIELYNQSVVADWFAVMSAGTAVVFVILDSVSKASSSYGERRRLYANLARKIRTFIPTYTDGLEDTAISQIVIAGNSGVLLPEQAESKSRYDQAEASLKLLMMDTLAEMDEGDVCAFFKEGIDWIHDPQQQSSRPVYDIDQVPDWKDWAIQEYKLGRFCTTLESKGETKYWSLDKRFKALKDILRHLNMWIQHYYLLQPPPTVVPEKYGFLAMVSAGYYGAIYNLMTNAKNVKASVNMIKNNLYMSTVLVSVVVFIMSLGHLFKTNKAPVAEEGEVVTRARSGGTYYAKNADKDGLCPPMLRRFHVTGGKTDQCQSCPLEKFPVRLENMAEEEKCESCTARAPLDTLRDKARLKATVRSIGVLAGQTRVCEDGTYFSRAQCRTNDHRTKYPCKACKGSGPYYTKVNDDPLPPPECHGCDLYANQEVANGPKLDCQVGQYPMVTACGDGTLAMECKSCDGVAPLHEYCTQLGRSKFETDETVEDKQYLECKCDNKKLSMAVKDCNDYTLRAEVNTRAAALVAEFTCDADDHYRPITCEKGIWAVGNCVACPTGEALLTACNALGVAGVTAGTVQGTQYLACVCNKAWTLTPTACPTTAHANQVLANAQAAIHGCDADHYRTVESCGGGEVKTACKACPTGDYAKQVLANTVDQPVCDADHYRKLQSCAGRVTVTCEAYVVGDALRTLCNTLGASYAGSSRNGKFLGCTFNGAELVMQWHECTNDVAKGAACHPKVPHSCQNHQLTCVDP